MPNAVLAYQGFSNNAMNALFVSITSDGNGTCTSHVASWKSSAIIIDNDYVTLSKPAYADAGPYTANTLTLKKKATIVNASGIGTQYNAGTITTLIPPYAALFYN